MTSIPLSFAPRVLAAVGPPILPGWADAHTGLRPFVAELVLILTIVAVLLTPFFTRRSNRASAAVALAGLVVALLALLAIGMGGDVFGWRLAGMLVTDPAAVFWKILLLVFSIGIVLLWFATTSVTMHEGDGPEFFTLLLGAVVGMCLMSETTNLLMLVIAVETSSLPSYVLAGFRKTVRVGAEASLKYVLFGAVTSSAMIYGVSLLYGLYGTLQLAGPDGLGARVLAGAGAAGPGSGALLAIAVFGLLAGIGFKISAVPFHFWCPDVFEGAGIDVAAFLSVASKGAGLMLLIRILQSLGAVAGYAPHTALPAIAAVIGAIAVVTATVGNTAAFVQTNIKRLLAYSSIAHAGYMLCAVSLFYRAATPGQYLSARPALQALLLYLAVYLFMNLGAFTVAGLIYRHSGSEDLSEYAGLGKRSPVLAFCMAVFMFSLVGLPPFAGFVAKVGILLALIKAGSWWWILVAAVGVNTVLSLYYYARVVKIMYLQNSDEPSFDGAPLGTGISIACAAMLFLLFLGFGPMLRITGDCAQFFTGPTASLAAAPDAPPASPAALSTTSSPGAFP
jgi:NADH-quinone oxidoreductase subunit N